MPARKHQGEQVLPQMTANAKEAVEFLKRPEVGRWLLRLAGIPVTTGKSSLPGWRTYQVCLYQEHVLDMVRSSESPHWLLQKLADPELETVVLPSAEPEINLVKSVAARSLYAAGIDAGQVTIMAASAHRVKVVRVDPDWPLKSVDLFVEKAEKWWDSKMAAQPQELSAMGADPEFALRKPEGSMALASDFLKVNGIVGCDTTRYREELAMHQHPVAELRPAPSEDPDELFFHVHDALKLAGKKINNRHIEWLAGGMPFPGYPIGGHIHFGGLTPTFSLRRKLDAYLAIPLVLIEDSGCRQRRKRYGFLGDVREKEYGFEYRTLPSWLVHPDVTRGLLHLAHLVVTCQHELKAAPHLQLPVIKAYYRGDKNYLIEYVLKIWKELKTLPGYTLSRTHLDRYFTYLLSTEFWPATEDLRKSWGFV
ncbi:putative amidoligase domain-containing protein [Brevibacillus centrosporus]|uniref:putative amidoligase domain-containing protein n=1 Tax=Brevibacillus centrosporus TaxID=54910 RepID=UPI0038267AFB